MDKNVIMQNKKWILLLLAIVIIGINFIVYRIINKPALETDDVNLAYREIENTSKLLLNGYLGHLFKFKSLGNINWLVLPVLGYLLYTFRKRSKGERAFIVIYCLSLAFISFKGFFNSRYSMTMMPVTVSVVMYYLWEFFERGQLGSYKKYLLIFLFGLVMYNNFSYSFKTASIKKPVAEVPRFRYNILHFSFRNLGNIVRVYYTELHDIAALKIRGLMTLPNVLQDIEHMGSQSVFLVNNLPAFYYYTHREGYYYWCDDDKYYTGEGARALYTGRSSHQTAEWMKDSMKCNYIFTFGPYNEYSEEFNRFIEEDCDTLVSYPNGYLIFRVK